MPNYHSCEREARTEDAVGRVILSIAPVEAIMKRRDGGSIPGLAKCRVELIDPEDNAFGADFPDSVRSLRQRCSARGGVLRSTIPDPTVVTTAEAIVTRELLDTLPDAGLIAFRWEFTPTACSPTHGA